MIKNIIFAVTLGLFMESPVLAADDFDTGKERVGELRLELSEKKLPKLIHCRPKRGPEEFQAADGEYYQTWEYEGCGVRLGMISEKKGALKSIASITLFSPSTLKTQKGIQIGSTEQEVMEAYKPYWNQEESESSVSFVAGSVFGGLIFYFDKGKVKEIFLGAAAE